MEDGLELKAEAAGGSLLGKGSRLFRFARHGFGCGDALAIATQRPVEGGPVFRNVDDLAREQRPDLVLEAALLSQPLERRQRALVDELLADIGFQMGGGPDEGIEIVAICDCLEVLPAQPFGFCLDLFPAGERHFAEFPCGGGWSEEFGVVDANGEPRIPQKRLILNECEAICGLAI